LYIPYLGCIKSFSAIHFALAFVATFWTEALAMSHPAAPAWHCRLQPNMGAHPMVGPSQMMPDRWNSSLMLFLSYFSQFIIAFFNCRAILYKIRAYFASTKNSQTCKTDDKKISCGSRTILSRQIWELVEIFRRKCVRHSHNIWARYILMSLIWT
jgi:hypothetical protein